MKNLDWNTVEMTIDFKPGYIPVVEAVAVDLGSGTNKYKIVVRQMDVGALKAVTGDVTAEALTGDQRRERKRAINFIDMIIPIVTDGTRGVLNGLRKDIIGGMEPETCAPLTGHLSGKYWYRVDGNPHGSASKSEINVRDKNSAEKSGLNGLWAQHAGPAAPPLMDLECWIDIQLDDLSYRYDQLARNVRWASVIAWRYHIEGVNTPKCPEHLRRPDLRKLQPDEIWTEWHGGCSPVPRNIRVNVVYRDGLESLKGVLAGDMRWSHNGNETDVVRWRRHVEVAVDPIQPDADGWHPWTGGACPVSKDTKVEIRIRNGAKNDGPAHHFYWGHGETAKGGHDDIVAWRPRDEAFRKDGPVPYAARPDHAFEMTPAPGFQFTLDRDGTIRHEPVTVDELAGRGGMK